MSVLHQAGWHLVNGGIVPGIAMLLWCAGFLAGISSTGRSTSFWASRA